MIKFHSADIQLTYIFAYKYAVYTHACSLKHIHMHTLLLSFLIVLK